MRSTEHRRAPVSGAAGCHLARGAWWHAWLTPPLIAAVETGNRIRPEPVATILRRTLGERRVTAGQKTIAIRATPMDARASTCRIAAAAAALLPQDTRVPRGARSHTTYNAHGPQKRPPTIQPVTACITMGQVRCARLACACACTFARKSTVHVREPPVPQWLRGLVDPFRRSNQWGCMQGGQHTVCCSSCRGAEHAACIHGSTRNRSTRSPVDYRQRSAASGLRETTAQQLPSAIAHYERPMAYQRGGLPERSFCSKTERSQAGMIRTLDGV